MKNLLFISSYPLPLYKGSNQHAYFFLKSLTSNFNVFCIFFIQPENKKNFTNNLNLSDLKIKNYEICFFKDPKRISKYSKIPQSRYYEKIRKILIFPYEYMNLATHLNGKILINDFIKKYSIDIVHFEHFHYTKYLFYIPCYTKRVVVYHDLYHLIDWENLKIEKKLTVRLELFFTCLKKYIFEKIIEYRTDLKIFLNPLEMKFFPKRAVFIPHIVNPEIIFNTPQNGQFINILFLGGYNHQPNRISVRYIFEKILPQLVKKLKNFKIWVIGFGAENYKKFQPQTKFNKHICFKGFVPDINTVFQNMNIALFPILYGGGIKTKVIEAMAAGIPVITSPSGVFGLKNLPKNCVEVCSSPEHFLKSLVLLSENFNLRKERSIRGNEYIKQNHSFEKISGKIQDTYQSILRH
jgi:glycosyltransferase involved in cell wall biosynthesis